MTTLYSNTADTVWSDTSWSQTTRGVRFQSDTAGYLRAVRWYRDSSTSTGAVDHLGFWNSDGALIWSQSANIVDSGSQGWQETPVRDTVRIEANSSYIVGVHITASANFPRGAVADRVAADSPLLFDDYGEYYLASGFGYPGTAQATYMVPVDVVWSVDGPTGAEVISGNLNDWLVSGSGNAHQSDGLPYLTKSVVDTIKTNTDAIKAVTDEQAGMLDADWDAIKLLWKIAGFLTEAEIAAWNLFAQRAPSQLTGASGGGGSAFTAISDKIDALPPLITALQPPITGIGWALIDTHAFAGPLAWAQEADLYVVNFTTTPARLGHIDVDGVDWVPRLGWWTEWDGTYSGERHFIDFPSAYMYLPGRHLGGLLFWCEPDGEGTVEAWSYTP